jgi:autotransporter-associated beta strand protein
MKKHPLFARTLLLAALSAVGMNHASAADIFWDGTTGLFTTPANWDTDTVPGITDNAIIPTGVSQVVSGNAIDLSRLMINGGGVTLTGGTVTTTPFGDYQSPGAFEIAGGGTTGSLDLSGDAVIAGGRVRIGSGGGTGTVTLSGTSAYYGSDRQDTWVGGIGSTGSMTLTDSAQWNHNNDWFVVGREGGVGTLTLSNSSQLNTVGGIGNIVFGDSGTATGIVSDQASISTTAGEFWVGNEAGGNGSLTMSGNSSLTTGSWTVVGRRSGTGVMTMSGNATLTKTGGGTLIVADNADGTLIVKDNAQISVNSEFWVGQGSGNQATGTLNMEGGTISVDNWMAVGRDEAKGTINMTGGVINKNGTGSVVGPDLRDTAIVINGNADRVAVVNQSGGTINNLGSPTAIAERPVNVSEWNASGNAVGNFNTFRVGFGGQATVNISGNANYTATSVYIGSNSTSNNNSLNLNGGTFGAEFIEEGAGSGVVNFNGGILKAVADAVDFIRDFEEGDVTVQAGGLKFDSNGKTVGIGNSLQGTGGVTKLGEGTLDITGSALYQGATVVSAGTLAVTGTIFQSGSLSLASGATLRLNNADSLNDAMALNFNGISNVVLNYAGIETVGSLTINGFSLAPDQYTLAELQALGTTVSFTGDSGAIINVTSAIPEPSTVALVIGGLGLAALRLRRRA